jgi:hypothetical protein
MSNKKSDSKRDEQDAAISDFFSAVQKLQSLGVIRSNKHIADIAEFICCEFLGMTLVKSGSQSGFDGWINGEKCQVKYSGGKSTTIDLGNPDEYEHLFIVLGPGSALRPKNKVERWLVYSISSEVVKQVMPHTDNMRRYTRNQLDDRYFVKGFNMLSDLQTDAL